MSLDATVLIFFIKKILFFISETCTYKIIFGKTVLRTIFTFIPYITKISNHKYSNFYLDIVSGKISCSCNVPKRTLS